MHNFFVYTNGEGDLALTVGGYVSLAILTFLILVSLAVFTSKEKKLGTKQLAFCAVAIALAVVASMIKFFELPFGGSITLFSMLFIALIGYWYGARVGITAAVAYGMVQFLLEPYILSIPQVIVDYPLAFGALGIAGFFTGKKYGLIKGYIAGVFGRFCFAVLSGVIFFASYAPEGMHPFVYSTAYNGTYLAVEALLTIVILLIPAVYKAIDRIGKIAMS
ncbi:MAG: energy-coupled thiamine transporter ThiT [Clostridia bacterium]|nr:energy-coupled thiamine transporter ThiT [Clostridia bacterium]